MAPATETTPLSGCEDLASISDRAVRHGFIQKVLGILGVQLLTTCVVAGLITIFGEKLVVQNPSLVVVLMAMSAVTLLSVHCVFMCFRETMRKSPQNYAFQNEVVLLQQLRDQESVIQVVDAEVDRERGRINIVMEAGDMDLGRFLQSQPRLTLIQIQHLWKQMLEAVQVIHQERIVHSDLKPGNFLLINGRLKVIDFGIAKRISNDTTNIQRDASVGTLSYMAPEAVKQGQLKLGRASDIWSLGIILYQMVYGHPPFAHLEPMQRLLRLNDPSLRIEFPAHRFSLGGQALVEVLGSCLQRDPRRRPSLCELLSHPFLEAPNSGRIPLQERPQEKQVMVPEPEKVARSSTLSLEEMLQRSKSKLSARHPRLDLPVVPEEKENLLRPPKAS